MEKVNQDSFVKYFHLIMMFLVLTALGVGFFFYCVQRDVKKNTSIKISTDIERQSNHFRSILDIQYDFLKGLAANIGKSESLLSNENRELIGSIYESDNFEHIALIEPDGIAHYDDGTVSDVSERRYFNEAILGSLALSDPLQSKKDGEVRVVLGVPVYEDGDSTQSVIGVLGASYNVNSLSKMLFNNYYDSVGYFMMVTNEGQIVFEDGMTDADLATDDNFFSYCEQMNFYDQETVQDIKSDFESQNGGLIEFEDNNENTYLVYEPLGRNGWMLCYCLPASKAKEEYHFIVKYEMYLAAYMLLVVAAFFVWVMFQNVKRQRAIIVYANTDALTGICNKKNTENRIEEWLQHPDCKGTQAFLMFDIDNFKQINDSYGHSAGDAVLHQIGSLMRSYFREGDIVGRVGGDEFVVLMKNVNSPEDAVYRARTLATKMRNIKIRGFEDTVVTCSMGLAFSPENGIAYRDLYGCADEALYVTKGNGRDGCTIYKKQFD